MVRIVNENKSDAQLEEMQDEIEDLKKQLKKKQSKKIFNCRSCGLLLVLVFLGLSAFGAYVLAQSGLVKIPILSGRFYQEPAPVYTVKSLEFNEKNLLSKFQSLALTQPKSGNAQISLDLSEEEITALLRDQIKKNPDLAQKINLLQIAVMPGEAQLFLKLNSPKAIVTLNFVPIVKDSKIVLQVKSFKIGALSLPNFLGSFFIENIASNMLNSTLDSVGSAGKLQEINLTAHKANLKILIANFTPPR